LLALLSTYDARQRIGDSLGWRMNQFDYIFGLIGLVLGLSLVEVLSGLARTLKKREAIHIGWLTPMLGVAVIADVTTFWGMIWQIRDLIPRPFPALGVGVLITGTYYLAASLVFPSSECRDHDEHYFAYKAKVLGLVILCNLMVFVVHWILGMRWSVAIWALNGVWLALAAITALVKGRRANIVMLSLLLIDYLWIFSS
jgi:hypothetical protein